MSCARVLSLAILALAFASAPADGQLGSLRKRLEDKAKEQLGRRNPQDTSARAPAGAPAPTQSGTAAPAQPAPPDAPADARQQSPVAVYPGSTLHIGTGSRPSCCTFHVQEAPEKVVAFYAPAFGPAMTMEQFEAKYPSAKQMTQSLRAHGAKAWFVGTPQEVGGMPNMASVLMIVEMAPGRLEFELPVRRLDSDAQMQHVTRYIREGLRILPAGADPGGAPPVAEDEEPSGEDEDLPLTQDVLDRYLRARAAEAAEEQRQDGIFAQREPQLRKCVEEVPRALPGIDGEFVQYYCGGSMSGMPDASLVGARAGALRSYQYARLREHIGAYVEIRRSKGPGAIRKSEWPMWNSAAFAVLDRNWDRVAAAHRED